MPKDNTFEKNMEAMNKLSPDEMKAKMAELTKICICPGCPVTEKVGLRWIYYCTKGSGKERE